MRQESWTPQKNSIVEELQIVYRVVACPVCGQTYQIEPQWTAPAVSCSMCGSLISLIQAPAAPMDTGCNVSRSDTLAELDPSEVRLRQWGVGLMALGLVGLTLPLFGLQLRRLRNLGDAQWMVLCAATLVGCCLFAYTWRRNLLVAGGASASALLLMTVLALASFGPWDRQGMLGKAPAVPRPAAEPRESSARRGAPSPAPSGRSADAAEAGSTSQARRREEATRDPVELTRRTVQLLERTRDLLRDVVDVPSATRASRPLKSISQERDEVVQLLEQVKPHITAEQNRELGRLHGERLAQLASELAAQLLRIGSIPGASDALQGSPGGGLEGKVADGASPASIDAAQSLADDSQSSIPGVANTSRVGPPDMTDRPPPDFPPLPEAQVPLPPLVYNSERINATPPAGPLRGNSFQETAPPRGVLVGLRVVKGQLFGGALQAIQSIYQVEEAYVLGRLQGDPDGERLQVLAPPGWAVGQVHVRQGLVLNAVRLVFYQVHGNGVVGEHGEPSDWLGSHGGGEMQLGEPGALVVGVSGSHDRQGLSLGVQQLRAELTAPSVPLPALTYASGRVQPSRYLGNPSGTEFIDVAPPGGILVGLILSQGTNWGGALRAVQPIYQVEDRYEPGQRHGLAGGSEVRVLARPGYAVAGLRVRSGLVLNAVQVMFMRWEGKQLISREAYASDWVGADGGGPAEFFAEGRALAGVFGRYKEDLHGLGVGVIPQLRVTPSAAVSPEQPRSWRSADGQYTIVATLVEVADDHVVLRREDGRTVKVPVSRLSPDDRNYLRNR